MESYSLKDADDIPFDHKLVKLLNIRNGVFIEVGANNGIAQSNTFLLEEQFDWTGILISLGSQSLSFISFLDFFFISFL